MLSGVSIQDAVALCALLGCVLFAWYSALVEPRKNCLQICRYNLQFSILFTLYACTFPPSKWLITTVPQLVNTTSTTLDLLLEAFPSDLELVFHNNNNTLNISQPVVVFELDYALWKQFNTPLKQNPLMGVFPPMESMSTLFESMYRLATFQRWSWAGLDVAKHRPSHADHVREFRVGEHVMHAGNNRTSRISAYVPSYYLDEFTYLLEDNYSLVPLRELAPVKLRVYMYAQDPKEIPLDAHVVLTPKHIALLQGYSFHFGDYWQHASTVPTETMTREIEETHKMESLEQCRALVDIDAWNRVEMCPMEEENDDSEPQVWYPLTRETVEKRHALRVLGSLFCLEDADTAVRCSRNVALRKISNLQNAYAPFFSNSIASTVVWFIFFFALQCMGFALMTCMMCDLFIAPVSYLVLNFLCLHVDDNAIGYLTCLYTSMRAFQCAMALVMVFGLRGHDYVLVPISAFNCAVLLYRKKHPKSTANVDEERNKYLQAYNKRKPGRAKREIRNAEELICRICFTAAEHVHELISPCVCDGTMQYVHRECLREWRMHSSNKQSFARCNQCNYPYKLRKNWRDQVCRCSGVILFLCLLALALSIYLLALLVSIGERALWGNLFCEMLLGAKTCAYVKEGAWELGAVDNANARRFVEYASQHLVFVDLSQLALSIAVWGIMGFFLGNLYFHAWNLVPDDSILAIIGGGRLTAAICIGLLRWLDVWWRFWKLKTGEWVRRMTFDGGNEVESVNSVKWKIPVRTMLRTPFGVARVLRHRREDDIVEMKLQYNNAMLYRPAVHSANQDYEL